MINLKRLITKIYWKIFHPNTLGVRILIIDKNKILLVKHTYLPDWYIPGGGVNKNENLEEAIKREVKEEIGINILKPKLFGVYKNRKEGKNDTVIIFVSKQKIENTLKPHDNELEEIRMFNLTELPEEISPGSKNRIIEYLNKDFPKTGIW